MRYNSSKDIILKTACEMFYLKGYNNTTFEDIAKRCSITKQAITYHFGAKAALGRAVSQEHAIRLYKSFTEAVISQAGEVDSLTLSAAFIIWFSGYYRKDANAFRFFEEFIFSDPNFDDIAKDQEDTYFSTFSFYADQTLTGTEIKIKAIGAFYAGKGLLHQYSKGLLSFSEDEFAWYLYLNYYSPYIAEKDELQRIYRQAREILGRTKSLDIRMID